MFLSPVRSPLKLYGIRNSVCTAPVILTLLSQLSFLGLPAEELLELALVPDRDGVAVTAVSVVTKAESLGSASVAVATKGIAVAINKGIANLDLLLGCMVDMVVGRL